MTHSGYNDPVLDEYDRFVDKIITERRGMAHCDQWVLHSPGTCEYCDLYPELQQFREEHAIQFTNEEWDASVHEHGCPALHHRPLATIERWGGNISHVELE